MQKIDDIEQLIVACEAKEDDAKARMDTAIENNDVIAFIVRGEWLAWIVLGRHVRAITRPEPYSDEDFQQRLARAFERIESHELYVVLPDEPGQNYDRVLASIRVRQYVQSTLRHVVNAEKYHDYLCR